MQLPTNHHTKKKTTRNYILGFSIKTFAHATPRKRRADQNKNQPPATGLFWRCVYWTRGLYTRGHHMMGCSTLPEFSSVMVIRQNGWLGQKMLMGNEIVGETQKHTTHTRTPRQCTTMSMCGWKNLCTRNSAKQITVIPLVGRRGVRGLGLVSVIFRTSSPGNAASSPFQFNMCVCAYTNHRQQPTTQIKSLLTFQVHAHHLALRVCRARTNNVHHRNIAAYIPPSYIWMCIHI